ncbi:carbohydrate binding domain-containing protein [Cryobacterium fucosi]|uniref:carbohydrate binding domain-containing protein n=1 Tax=Cryobacterium fucosi TaxID=1259157 RepID=UPI00141B670A|nr:carbohydrate binding domain-containing protein [Cryobacterium fucosi]
MPALILPTAFGALAPAAAASVSTLADFEGGAPTGFFAYGSAGYGVLDVAPGSPDARPGQTSPTKVLSYGFNITAAGSFGGVGHNFATAGDWTGFQGVSYWLRGSGNGSALQFEIFDGGANSDSSERFDYTITDDVAGWREIQIPWASFTRATDYQPGGAPNDGLNLTTMWGYALPAARGADTVLVDDIALYSAADVTATATLSASTYEVIEGRAAAVEVRLNVAPTTPITVDYATSDGTAGATDYTSSTGTLTFAAGQTTQSISVATTDDAAEEPSETLAVTLSNPVGAALGSPSAATLTILDNDAAPVGPPTGRTLLVENFEAPLPVGSAGAVQVGWFAAQDPSSTVGFASTDALPAPVPADPPTQGNTALSADFTVQSFGVVVNNFTNDTASAWTTQDWSSYEGIGFWMYGNGSGTRLFLDIEDNRNPGSTTDDAERFVVEYTDNWTGWKFQQFDFADFVRKNINNNAPNDGLGLTDVHGFALGALRTPGTQTFYYDDVLLYGQAAEVPLTVGFDRAGYEVTEGADATATVRLNRVATEPVTVAFQTEESAARTATEDLPATQGRDFTAASGTVTIPAGQREATITVPTLQNAKHEVDETFLVALTNPVGAEFGFVRTATVSIQDDDAIDKALVEDFESYPWLFDTEGGLDLALRETAADTGYAGADAHENVLDIAYDDGAKLVRDFAAGQDWSAYKGLSFWYNGEGTGDKVTVSVADNEAPDPGPSDWVQSWSDEFEGPAGAPANPDNWSYETGGWGWGNDELQYYTDSTDNAALDGNGNLVITAREIDPATTDLVCWYGPCTNTSARLISEQKQEFEYGRIESRVQVPKGSGIWPAVWTLGNDFREVGWPQTGEIDVMEFVGRLPNEIFGTIHGPGYSGGNSIGNTYTFDVPVSDDWHTFSMEWTPERIDWFVDGIQYHSATPADVAPNEWVYDHPFSLLTNVAVGGNFGGAPGADLVFPQSLTVDYIRVFQAADTAERFEAKFVDNKVGWRQVTIPFADLRRSKDQPAGAPKDGLTLTDVNGYGFAFTGTGAASLDKVTLLQTLPPKGCVKPGKPCRKE